MFWSLSLQLLPEETIIEESPSPSSPGIRPTYSVFLTNKRVVFRFDGFGSMFITYLVLRTGAKEYFLHVAEPERWASRILDTKAGMLPQAAPPPARTVPSGELAIQWKRRELRAMLATLRKHDILTDAEVRDKARLIDELRR